MVQILATLLTMQVRAQSRMQASLDSRLRRDERGSVTTEHVLWAVAVIAIVAVVVAAVKTYVTTQAGNIQ